MTPLVTADKAYSLRTEVTVAVCILEPDRMVMGDNVSVVTFAFEAPGQAPPRAVSDPEINATLARQISRVVAAIRVVMPQLGLYELEGTVDEPMAANSRPVGKGLADAVTVHLDLVPEARA